MPESALGVWLKGLRDDRDLSLRDVAQRGDVDHAYVHRLETGAKEAPSEEVIQKLTRALAPSVRDEAILRYLAKYTHIDVDLANFARQDTSLTPEEFHMLTTAVNRGTRADYSTSLTRIRRIMREDEDG